MNPPTNPQAQPVEPDVPEVLPVQPNFPEVLPLERPAPQLPQASSPTRTPPRPRRPQQSILLTLLRLVLGFFGWCWRWVVGAALCQYYWSSILVTGWTYRWMQGLVLRGWWRQSRFAREGSFEDFCTRLGPQAPVAKPRWFLRERLAASLRRPGPDGRPASTLRLALRIVSLPWHSLWLNFKTGFKALFCTYLLTGWGCLLMYFGWEFGWLNSSIKGYEQAFIGPLVSILGILLFIVGLFYVLMAQVHQAATGEARAFFDFRFVWLLVRARTTAYCGLVALLSLVALPLEILKSAPFVPVFFSHDDSLTNTEVLQYWQLYLFVCGLVLFPGLLLVRRVAARIYRSAVLKVLREGTVAPAELNPILAGWLERLEMMPIPVASYTGLNRVVRAGSRRLYRWGLYTVMFLLGFSFVAQTYVGEFLMRYPGAGYVNHVLVQFPALDYVPGALKAAADAE